MAENTQHAATQKRENTADGDVAKKQKAEESEIEAGYGKDTGHQGTETAGGREGEFSNVEADREPDAAARWSPGTTQPKS